MGWKWSWNWHFVWAMVAAFVVFMLTDWAVHHHLMQDMYAATASLWRPQEQMQEYFNWYLLSMGLFSWAFAWIFTLNWENKGWMEGVRYGIAIALLYGAATISWHAFQPIPMNIIWSWVAAFIVQFALAGIAVAWFYKPKA